MCEIEIFWPVLGENGAIFCVFARFAGPKQGHWSVKTRQNGEKQAFSALQKERNRENFWSTNSVYFTKTPFSLAICPLSCCDRYHIRTRLIPYQGAIWYLSQHDKYHFAYRWAQNDKKISLKYVILLIVSGLQKIEYSAYLQAQVASPGKTQSRRGHLSLFFIKEQMGWIIHREQKTM